MAKDLDLTEFGGAPQLDLNEFQNPPPKPAGAFRRVADTGLALAKGVVGVPEAAVGAADLVTKGRAGKLVEGAGVRFKDAKDVLTGFQSEEQQAADAEVQQAKGFLPTLGAMVRNPSTIVNAAAESAPSMLAGGVVSRGVMRAIPKNPIAAGAVGEGVVAAGQNAEQVRQQTADGLITNEQAAILGASGAATGAISLGSGALANKLGIGDVNTMLATGKVGTVGDAAAKKAAGKGAFRKVGEGAVVEGVGQELPQSYQEQVGQNLALGKPWDEGAAEAAAQGMLVGGLTGAAGGALGAMAPEQPAPLAPPPVAAGAKRPTAPAVPPLPTIDPGAIAQPAPTAPGMGYDPNGGTMVQFPDGSQSYASELPTLDGLGPNALPPLDPNALQGAAVPLPTIDPNMGPLSGAAALLADKDGVISAPVQPPAGQQADGKASKQTAEPAPVTPAQQPVAQTTPAAPAASAPLETSQPTGPIATAAGRAPAPALVPAPEGQAATAQPAAGEPAASTDPAQPGPAPLPAATNQENANATETTQAVEGQAQRPEGQPEGGAPVDALDAAGQPAGDGQVETPVQGAPEPAGPQPVAEEPAAPVVDDAAHTAATSPANDLPEPTEAQKKAGNYPKGHVKLGGMDLSIENPAGSVRKGVDRKGKAWENTLQHHYGYIRGTIGNDKDHVDAFVKPGTPLNYDGRVFVIDQIDPDTGKFDEHKVLIGFENQLQAAVAYKANYAKGWKGMKAMTPMSMAEFKAWVYDGPKNKPLAAAKAETPAPAPAEPTTPAPAPAPAPAAPEGSLPSKYPVGSPAWSFDQNPPSKRYTKAEAKSAWDAKNPVQRARITNRIPNADGTFKIGAFQALAAKSWDELTPEQRAQVNEAMDDDFRDYTKGNKGGSPVPKEVQDDQRGKAAWEAMSPAKREAFMIQSGLGIGADAQQGKYSKWEDLAPNLRAKVIESLDAKAPGTPVGASEQEWLEKYPVGTRLKVTKRESLNAEERKLVGRTGVVTKGHFAGVYITLDPTSRERSSKEVLLILENAPDGRPSSTQVEVVPKGAEPPSQEAVKEANTPAARKQKQADIFTELAGNPAMIGKTAEQLREAITERLGLTKLTPPQLQKMADSLAKEITRRQAELEKNKHRNPEVLAAAKAAAVAQAYPDASSITAEQQSAFLAGFAHAMADKTKSTLAGDNLPQQLAGYKAARKWIETEEGRAWFEGRPVNKLQNTGVDLRRWYEQMKNQMKADESDITKAWKQIERATARADLFSTLLPDGVFPGYRLYIEDARAGVVTFREWLDKKIRWEGYESYRSKYSDSKTNVEYILEGERYPSDLTDEDRDLFRSDPAYRARYLRDRAAEYIAQVQAFVEVFDKSSSVEGAATKFTERFIERDPKAEETDKSGYRASPVLNEAGLKLIRSRLWSGGSSDLMKLRLNGDWTQTLIEKEATIEVPGRSTPLAPPKLDHVTRDGKDYRQGVDITPDMAKKTFGFADVGFGKWVGAKQDQDHLNYAHDAFRDLAAHMGVPVDAIGFGGKMHFTIGALGHGKFAAHFSPNQPSPVGPVQVINVTNTRGDGTIAHEWTHALDHFLGGGWATQVRPLLLRYLTTRHDSVESVEKRAKDFLYGGWYFKGDKRASKLETAMRAMRNEAAMRRPTTAYKTNADQLGKDYWGNDKELIARAAEAWVGDTLGFSNTYLVNPAWSGEGMVTQDKGFRGTPYPTGTERALFNKLFAGLAKSIKWKDGQPTVSIEDFRANLPEEIKAGEARRKVLQTEEGMKAFQASEDAKRAEQAATAAEEQARKEREEQEELDRLAAEQMKDLEPPPAPPIVDAPAPESGPLTDDDLERMFDQAAAELQESKQETPDRPPPEEKPPVTGSAWTQADLDEMMAAQDESMAAGIATAEKLDGLPTIHELGAMGQTEHFGDGMFRTSGHHPPPDNRSVGRRWVMFWDGGGAMRKTKSGKSYTLVKMQEGARPFTMSLKAAMEAVGSLPNPRPEDAGLDRIKIARDRIAAGRAEPGDLALVQDANKSRSQENGAQAAQNPSAAALIAQAAKLGVTGANEALSGLAALFGGGKGRLNSFGAGFDEETYQKAKPHFKAALAAFQAAGKTLKDLFKMLIDQFGVGVKEYAIRFAKDEGLTAQLGSKPSAAMQIAEKVRVQLANDAPFDWRMLFRWADEAYGGTQAEGKYTPKDAYDAMEAGMNRFLMSSTYSPWATREAALSTLANLTRVTNMLPTQTKRTEEQDQFQQFSTVPPLAFIANWVANITSADTVMEPSAGIGGLAVFAKNAGAKLVLNELSSRRAALLQEVFPTARVFTENAEQIDNILPADISPTVVVMNPPFSNSAATGVIKNTMVGAQHVEQALERLAPGGRLVAIVGDGMALDKPTFKAWWAKIRAKYDVRAVVPVDGKGYAKYGTTFDNVLLVIDKVKPLPDREPVRTPVKDYNDLIGLLAEVQNDRPAARTPVDERPGIESDAAESELEEDADQPGGGSAVPEPGAGVGNGQPGGRRRMGGGGGGGGRAGRGKRPGSSVRNPEQPAAGAGDNDAPGGAGDPLLGGGPGAAGDTTGVTIGSGEVKAGELTDSVFEGYVPQRLTVEGAKPHPGPLVQSSAMASVLPPAVTYTPNLPKPTITKGLLSLAQIESVVYAGQAHQEQFDLVITPEVAKKLGKPDGSTVKYRRGFFIGDGTGVGKGREISGILLDNIRQGRKKHVWVSEKQGLMNDAKRDFGGVGGDDSIIFNQNKTEADGKIDTKDGILFTTYSTLRSGTVSATPKTSGAEASRRFNSALAIVRARNVGDRVKFTFGLRGEESVQQYDGVIDYIYQNGPNRMPQFDIQIVGGPDAGRIVDRIGVDNEATAMMYGLPPPEEKKAKKASKSRLDQLVEWLGPDFDGVIAFDEAHNAGNAVPIKGERGASEPSAQALAVVELQNRLPNARVVYVSATGATEVSNLSFATRLGLWGSGTPFPTVQNFVAEMDAGGLATMELVARDMKQMGAYLARSLSFDGVTYSRVEHELTSDQEAIYNRLAEAWQVTLQNMTEALATTNASGPDGQKKKNSAKSAMKSAYWGAQQRFFNQIITSMQMPTVIESIERDLQSGDAIVLQLVNTNEAQQERAMEKRKEDGESTDLEDLDLTPRDQLIQLVEKSFPVQQYEDFMDSEGKAGSRPVLDSEGRPVLNRQAVAMREKLLQDLRDIRVPDGPMEMILNAFGPEITAEVTGRKQRVVRKPDKDGKVVAQVEKRGASAARADADAFMADQKRILIFSDAGGTGFSFQADLTKPNQRKRKHYLIQPGWRANKAVQGLGRTHRTNQKSAPHYTLASTNIPAHKRFLSSIARRLDQLGALTKGQRDTSSGGLFSEKDNLESKYATQAAKQLILDIQRGQVPGISFVDFLTQMGLEDIVNKDTQQIAEDKFPPTRQFLNRLLSLTLPMQGKVFDAFIQRMEEKVEVAAQRGELDTGMQTIRAMETTIVQEEVVYTDPRTKAETTYVQIEAKQPTRFFDITADERVKSFKGDYVRNVKSGRVWVKIPSGTMTLKNGTVVDRFRMEGTNGMQIKSAEDFAPGAYVSITREEAQDLWERENQARPATYTETVHMITGAMLPIWDRLKTTGAITVARTQTSDGRRLLGRVIANKDVAEIRKRLDLGSAAAKLSPEQIMARILKGDIAELANGWKLERARVSDNLRIELKLKTAGVSMGLERELQSYGVKSERINWQTRFFVPTGKDGVPVLEAILKSKPVVDLIDPKAGQNGDEAPAFNRMDDGPFYSALSREVGAIPAKAQGAPGWAMNIAGLVKAGKVKQDEVDWSGVLDWLKLQEGKVTRDQLVQYLDANGVRVEETMLGSAAEAQWKINDMLAPLGFGAVADAEGEIAYIDEDGDLIDYTDLSPEAQAIVDRVSQGEDGAIVGATKYGTYQLPGGTNYREILLTLPDRPSADRARFEELGAMKVGTRTPAEDAEYRALGMSDTTAPNRFKSGHWDQPNVLAHIRVNDRTDAEGRRVLFVEEIQSDWGQAAKRKGFQGVAPAPADKLPDGWTVERDAGQLTIRDASGAFAGARSLSSWEDDATMMRKALETYNAGLASQAKGDGVPRAPFVGKTDAWLSLALKRIVKMAVDEGYDRVAFINGEQSAERYDLSKQVDSIKWRPNGVGGGRTVNIEIPSHGTAELLVNRNGQVVGSRGARNVFGSADGKQLDEVIGKEIAAKIMEDPDGDLSGNGLKVGGEGMKAFYDKIVPNTLKDVLRKVGGGALETVELQLPGLRPGMRDPETGATLGPNFEQQAGVNADQPGFTITPAMQERAAGGLPMFDRQGYTATDATRPAATPDTRPDAARNIGVLERAIGGGADSVHPYDARVVPGSELLQRIAGAFGESFQGFGLRAGLSDRQRKTFGFFNGAYLKGTIYLLDRGNDRPHLAILGHELAHRMRKARPDLYQRLVDAIDPYINTRYDTEFVNTSVASQVKGEANIKEEFIGEVLSDGFMDKQFWRALGDKNPSLLGRVVDFIGGLIDQIKAKLGYTVRTARYLRDYDKVMQLAGEVMAEYGTQPPGGGSGGAPVYSRRDGFAFDARKSPLYKTRTAAQAGAITQEQADKALQTDAVARRILAKGITVQEGELVGARLNINVFKNTGVPVNTVHRGNKGQGYTQNRGLWGGEVITYAPVVTLRDAYFNVGQKAREAIASGTEAKSPMASIDGRFHKAHSFDGVEFRFNPKREHLFRDGLGRVLRHADEVTISGSSAYARGEIEYYGPEDVPARAGDAPTQGRLMEPGNDDGTPMFARMDSAQTLSDITRRIQEATSPIGSVSLWDKTVGTQYNKATKDADFKRVFDAYYQQTDDTAHYAIEAEKNAPDVLLRLDNMGDIWKGLKHSGAKQQADLEAVSRALFANIEGVSGVKQVDYDDQNLREIFNLTPKQIEMYRQVRAAVNTSIERLAQTYAAQFGHEQGIPIERLKNMSLEDTVAVVRTKIEDERREKLAQARLRASVAEEDAGSRTPEQAKAAKAALEAELRAINAAADKLANRIDKIQEQANYLTENAYMPALRFGEYAVTVTQENEDGERETLHFEMFESQMAANLAAAKLAKEYPDAEVVKSVMNKEQYAMFKGVSPETVSLFAKFTGMDQNEAVQNYIALAKSSRSVLMRQLKRKGVAGFSTDATRVLASFLTSNARQAAINMNQGAITDALSSKSLARKGDMQLEAQRLSQYMNNPLEEARRVRGFLFMHFLGGSVASALVNMTQPVLQTAPYLAQFAGTRTAAIMASSARMAASGRIEDADLRAAVKRAADDGITEPHEIHQLMADASGSSIGTSLRARAAVKAWGSFFSLAEAYNRRLTFLAAYQVAQDGKHGDAYEFARKAVIETQGLYGKVNRPNWARGPVGATLFTFKQFSIAYVEFLRRLPNKQKALALGILVLAAGLQGLPFAEDIEDLIDTIGQSLGYNTNSKKALRQALIRTFGETVGEILDSGIFTQTSVDVQGRLGMGNLLPGTAMFKPSETDKTRTLSEFAGPLGGLVVAAQKALAKAQRGDIAGAGQEMLPVAAKNFAQGMDMLRTGIYKDTRGYKVADVTAAESFLKMLGLQPGTIAEKTRRISSEFQDKAMVTMMESMIADQWAKGIAEKDPAMVERARTTLATWNAKNPESQIRIEFSQIRRRVQQMAQTREQRFLKTVPKEMRASTAQELAR